MTEIKKKKKKRKKIETEITKNNNLKDKNRCGVITDTRTEMAAMLVCCEFGLLGVPHF